MGLTGDLNCFGDFKNAIAELAMDKGRHTHALFHGDTILAAPMALDKPGAKQPNARVIKLMPRGKGADGTVVVEIGRTVLIKKKSHYFKPA
jgi:acyl dehydratase